ncbi:putative Gamma-butyrobetaine hydroxylase subfamily [Aspergillus affinis]|uniref:putative Gamma-butyrobetaine hydroxylase subfamily n=1 Tax=Aspergillus affinis TaxID=1070780 RepID=UPI0022FED68F|nr:putative gamma-butyrobetaine [Aspergillus affinis]KAI9037450.1 putative gamma-butyrobetaine [Aspergillus affinis]
MVRLLRAFTSSARAVAPSSLLLQRRCYFADALVDAFKSTGKKPPQAPHDAQMDARRVVESVGDKTLPLLDLEGPVPEGIYVNGKMLGIPKKHGRTWYLHTMLRDACRCPQCVDPHSKQRNFRTSDINIHVRPQSIRLDGDTLEIKWKNDLLGHSGSHVSTYNLEELHAPTPIPIISTAGAKRRRFLWDRDMMEQTQHWIDYEDYMQGDNKFVEAMRHLALTGLIFVKNIPDTRSRSKVEKIATKMGPLRNTFYGQSWDVRSVPQAKNVAYTNQNLDFHMDLMYTKNPPGYQLLHCLENSSVGGESLFLDSFSVAQVLHTTCYQVFERLTQMELNYEYNHEDDVYNCRWPVFEVGSYHSSTNMDLRYVNYSPPFQGRLLKMRKYKHASEGLRALNYFARMLEDKDRIFERKMRPGECAIFENRRVLHARRPFDLTSGSRWLAGTYVDDEALMSKFRTLSRKYPHAWYKYPLANGKQTWSEMKLAGLLAPDQMAEAKFFGGGDEAEDEFADRSAEAEAEYWGEGDEAETKFFG